MAQEVTCVVVNEAEFDDEDGIVCDWCVWQ